MKNLLAACLLLFLPAPFSHGVQTHSLPPPRPLRIFPWHKDNIGYFVETIAFSPDGKTLAAGSYEANVKIWDVGTGKEQDTESAEGSVDCVAFSPDGKMLAVAAPGGVSVWSTVTWRKKRFLAWMDVLEIPSVAFSPDGRILAAGSSTSEATESGVRLWSTRTWRPIGTLSLHQHTVNALAFSPDGNLLVAGGDTIKIYSTKTWRRLHILSRDGVKSIAFTRDGKRFAAGLFEGVVRLYDTRIWRPVRTLRAQAIENQVAFSPDGKVLAEGGLRENRVILWDVGAGRIRQILAHASGPVAFSPNGKLLATDSRKGAVELWDVSNL